MIRTITIFSIILIITIIMSKIIIIIIILIILIIIIICFLLKIPNVSKVLEYNNNDIIIEYSLFYNT